jgi:hypothetical protein
MAGRIKNQRVRDEDGPHTITADARAEIDTADRKRIIEG